MKALIPTQGDYKTIYGLLNPTGTKMSGCQYSCTNSCSNPGACKSCGKTCSKCENPSPLLDLWERSSS